jgi:predicted N-acyltransferase
MTYHLPLIILRTRHYYQPGAGGGEFKYLRGFDPYLVSSVHHFRSPILGRAVGDFLQQERDRNQATADYLVANSAVAGTVSPTGNKMTVSVSSSKEEGMDEDE